MPCPADPRLAVVVHGHDHVVLVPRTHTLTTVALRPCRTAFVIDSCAIRYTGRADGRSEVVEVPGSVTSTRGRSSARASRWMSATPVAVPVRAPVAQHTDHRPHLGERP